jgi:hypothetical protein
MENSEIKFWTANEDQERLTCTSIKEAVDEWADDALADDAEMPEKITLYGFNPMQLPTPECMADSVLEYIAERLDDDYGDPDGYGLTDLSDSKEKAVELMKSIYAGYHVWAAEQVKTIEVDPREYIAEAV